MPGDSRWWSTTAPTPPASSARNWWPGRPPIGNSPEEFTEQIRKDYARWAKVAKDANIKPQ